MKKRKLLVALVVTICLLLTLTVVLVMAADGDEGHGGLAIGGAVEENVYNGTDSPYATDNYRMEKDLTVMPVTLEAWVYIPKSASGSNLGTLYGSYWTDSSYGIAYLTYEILAGGVPSVRWSDSLANVYDIRFESAKLPTNAWAHLAIVYDGDSGVVSCYVNGDSSEQKSYYPAIDPDALAVPMALGGDSRAMNSNYFKGEIGDVTVYSDIRSSSEIGSDYSKGMEMTKANADLSDAICYYDIDSDDMGKNIIDDTGNGNDLIYAKTWLTEAEMEAYRSNYGFEPAYSFAVIGDIQTMTDYYPEKLPTLYKWIVENKTAKNILMSIGLGDITNDNGRKERYVKDSNGNYVKNSSGTYTHWDIAYDAIKQLDGNIRYSLVRGNHDVYPDLTTGVRLEGFNTYFENSEYFTSQFTAENGGGRFGDGQYDTVNSLKDPVTGYKNSYANTFQTLIVGNNKYLFLTLDWKITDNVMGWAQNVVAAHPEHRVIISVHAYLNGDGTTLDAGDPTPNSSYNGEEIWQALASKYSNIEMVLSGHISNDKIVITQVKGDNGNTVTEMLIDQQGYDSKLGGCGMVAMFYFDESGDKLAVEWYSTTKDRYFKTTSDYVVNLKADAASRDYTAWDGVTATKPEGSGTKADPYRVANAENLYWISANITEGAVSFAGVYFEQTANIDLGGKFMPSIGYYYRSSRDMAAFGGIYNGGKYSITNGTITTSDSARSFTWSEGYGLFGVIYGATIKNVTLDDVQIIGRGVTGGIVGRAAAPALSDPDFAGFNSIVGCWVADSVRIVTLMTDGSYVAANGFDTETAAGRVGTVCGMAYSTVIKGCYSAADIGLSDGFNLAGGIVGTAGLNSTVEYCTYKGSIFKNENNALHNAYIGGIVGAVSPTAITEDALGNKLGISGGLAVMNCYNIASFISLNNAGVYYGSIAGYMGDSADYIVRSCYSTEGFDLVAGGEGYALESAFALAENELGTYISAIDAEVTAINGSECAPMWIIGSGAPTFAADDGLKYFDVDGNVYYIYAGGAWTPVKNISITETTMETEYGTIDSKYALNSIILFVNKTGTYECVGGYDTLAKLVDAIASNMAFNDGSAKCAAYFRADVTSTSNVSGNLGYARGEIVFDLNGHTLTQANSEPLFRGYSKYHASQLTSYPDAYYKPTYYTIKNGDIVLNSHGIFYFGMDGSAYNNDYNVKSLYWTLDGVDISLGEGATLTSLIGEYKEHVNLTVKKATHLDLTIKDNCTIDITNAKNEITLFDACDPIIEGVHNDGASYYTNSIVNVTVGACEIKADSSFTWHKVNSENGSSVTYAKNAQGKLATLSVPSTLTPASESFEGENGLVYELALKSEENGTATYTLVTEELDTPYGNIPSKYESSLIILFKKNANGSYSAIKGYSDFATALADTGNNYAYNDTTSTYVIYVTADLTNTNAGSGNIGFNTSTVIIDLGGHTVTQSGGAPLIRAMVKFKSGHYEDGYFEIRNGYIVLTDAGLFNVGVEGSAYNSTDKCKTVHWTLDNVHISLTDENKDVNNIIVSEWRDNNLTDKTNGNKKTFFNLTIKENCTIDISKSALTKDDKTYPVTLFNANDPNIEGMSSSTNYYANSIVNITVKGCKIIAKDTSFIWSSVNESNGSSVNINENAVTITLPNGTYNYDQIYTKYGKASDEYIGSTFLVFKLEDGVYKNVYGTNTLTDAISAKSVSARVYCASKGSTAVVYMTSDYASTAGVSADCNYIEGTMIIDLGGHTLTQAYNKQPIFRAYAKCTAHTSSNTGSGFKHNDANFQLINGNVVLNDHSLFYVGMEGSNNYTKSECLKAINWTLDNINVSLKSGATLTSVFTEYAENTGVSGRVRDMEFNLKVKENCTIDISNATKEIILFNANDGATSTNGNTNSIAKITIEGCKIIAGNANFVLSAVHASNGSAVHFTKADGGNYAYVVVSKDASDKVNTSEVFLTNKGIELVLVKVDEDKETVTYRLRDKELSEIKYTPKMSITLDENIVMNVYVPAKYLLKFTFDGVDYTDLTLLSENEKIIDGELYYLVTKTLSADEAAESVQLKVTISVGDKAASGTFTFDIVKYAKKVIGGNSSAAEIQLVRDVLSYVRSAYIYFKTQDSATIAKIDAVLGDNYDVNNAPAFDGSAEAPSAYITGTALVLDKTPGLRFYITENIDAYEFFADGVKLKTVTGSDSVGAYIEIDSYAYVMAKTITYKVNGAEADSYHIAAYYEYVKTAHKNDPGLIDLVERFAKYCESAEAYRVSVTK